MKRNISFIDVVGDIVNQRSCIGAGPNELDIHIASYQRENCWIEIVEVWMGADQANGLVIINSGFLEELTPKAHSALVIAFFRACFSMTMNLTRPNEMLEVKRIQFLVFWAVGMDSFVTTWILA